MFVPNAFSVGGWFTGALLIVFALVIWRAVVPGTARLETA